MSEVLGSLNLVALGVIWYLLRAHITARIEAHAQAYGDLDAKLARLDDFVKVEGELRSVQAAVDERSTINIEQYRAESDTYHQVWASLVEFYLAYLRVSIPNVTMHVDESRLRLEEERLALRQATVDLLERIETHRPFYSSEIAELMVELVGVVQDADVKLTIEDLDNRERQQTEAQALLELDRLYWELSEAIRHRLTGQEMTVDGGGPNGLLSIAHEIAMDGSVRPQRGDPR